MSRRIVLPRIRQVGAGVSDDASNHLCLRSFSSRLPWVMLPVL
jgi:hypothetical protein